MKTLYEFIEENEINIDKKILGEILNIIESDWVYVTNSIVGDLFGYTEGTRMMGDFYRAMKKKYQENIDYKEVDGNHSSAEKKKGRGGYLKKHYIVTSKTLIVMLIQAKTSKSLRCAEYFYSIHNLMIEYYKFQSEETRKDFTALMDMPHIKKYTSEQSLKYLEMYLKEKNELGVVYFVHEEGNISIHKIGYTRNMGARLEAMQISNPRKLEVYRTIITINPDFLEELIHVRLSEKCIRGEWFNITRGEIDEIISDIADDRE